jgi:hypothetical protein
MQRILAMLLCAAASTFAQVSTSQITGTVRDASGAVIPGTKVTATNEATGVNYSQAATATGVYAFPSVPIGSYTIAAEAPGFRTVKKTGAILTVDTPLAVDITL